MKPVITIKAKVGITAVLRYEIPDDLTRLSDYFFYLEVLSDPLSRTEPLAIVDVWIAYNQFPVPDKNEFYEKLILPSTSGDTIFSATKTGCKPHFNDEDAPCEGDRMGIHFNPKQINICKVRSTTGKCIIFIAYGVRSKTSNVQKLRSYVTGHSCVSLKPGETVDWSNSDCQVAPTSSKTKVVCNCRVLQEGTFSSSFLIPPKLLTSKLKNPCLSCSHDILIAFIIIFTCWGSLEVLIKHRSRIDLRSIELVDARFSTEKDDFIVTIETDLRHMPNTSDIGKSL